MRYNLLNIGSPKKDDIIFTATMVDNLIKNSLSAIQSRTLFVHHKPYNPSRVDNVAGVVRRLFIENGNLIADVKVLQNNYKDEINSRATLKMVFAYQTDDSVPALLYLLANTNEGCDENMWDNREPRPTRYNC